jgi:predicted secreted protein
MEASERPPSEVRAAVGVVELSLAETPGSGYLWTMGDLPRGLEEIDRRFEGSSEADVVGGSGRRIFRLRASTPGEYELEFRLKRPWEEEPLERRVMRLVVEAGEPLMQ